MATQANSVDEEGVTNGTESMVWYTYVIPGEEREFSMKKGTSIPLFLVNPTVRLASTNDIPRVSGSSTFQHTLPLSWH